MSEKVPAEPQTQAVFLAKRHDFFIDLLYEMGSSLNYDFDKTEISKDAYWTEFQAGLEQDAQIIRTKLVEILTGKAALPMAVVQFPIDADAASDSGAISQDYG